MPTGILSKAVIKNFKSHKDTEVTFTPGVNVIIGETDSGKSALLSALRWHFTGKPKGESVRSWWGGATSVSVEFSDGVTVGKVRSGTGTVYSTSDGQVLKSTDGSIPAEVEKLISISEELGVQRQLAPVFMLSLTGGQAAAAINSITNLDEVTGTQGAASKAIRNCKKNLELAEASVLASKQAFGHYARVPALQSAYEQLSTLVAELDRVGKTVAALQSGIHALAIARDALRLAHVAPDVSALLGARDALPPVRTRQSELQAKYSQFMLCKTELASHAKDVQPEAIEKLKGLQYSIAGVRSTITDAESLIARVNKEQRAIRIRGAQLSVVTEEKLAELKAGAEQLPKLLSFVVSVERGSDAWRTTFTASVAAEKNEMAARDEYDRTVVQDGKCVLCGSPRVIGGN